MSRDAVHGTILVADDDRVLLDVLIDALEMEGYRIIVCTESFEAVRQLRDGKPDVAILDLFFRGSPHGLAIVDEIRQDPAIASTPLIVWSVATRRLHTVERELRALGCLIAEKPIDLDRLLKLVEFAPQSRTRPTRTPMGTLMERSLPLQLDAELAVTELHGQNGQRGTTLGQHALTALQIKPVVVSLAAHALAHDLPRIQLRGLVRALAGKREVLAVDRGHQHPPAPQVGGFHLAFHDLFRAPDGNKRLTHTPLPSPHCFA